MTSSPSAPSHTDRQHHALQSLGLSEDTITRLGMNASLVPGSKEPGFEELVRLCRNHMNAFMPDTVLMPWRRAAHKDHRAVWQVVRQALKDELMSVRELEYSLMNWEQGQDYMLLPKTDETQAWRLDTSPVVDKKRQAISGSRFSFSNSTAGAEAHHYRMVQDPSADKLHSWEIYLEPACSLQ
jgi:LmbE family N-acetylglucosaminyl deacetylase